MNGSRRILLGVFLRGHRDQRHYVFAMNVAAVVVVEVAAVVVAAAQTKIIIDF